MKMESTLNPSIGESLKDRILNSILRLNEDDDDLHNEQDICRVCRLAGEDTLYHPCLCTGSIKFVHQDCLTQWLKYSKKEVCELCNHKFSFRPVYRSDMPDRLPIHDLIKGLFSIILRFSRLLFTYFIVTTCWLGIVPLIASRIYKMVFSGLISSFFSLKILNLFSTENIAVDIGKGSVIVSIFLCTFISLVWLREQIMVGGAPGFMHLIEPNNHQIRANQQNEIPLVVFEAVDEPQNAEVRQNNEINDNPIMQENFLQLNEENVAMGQDERFNLPLENLEQNVVAEEVQLPPVEENIEVEREAIVANDINDIERIVDDFTWQRLLGFDGTFAFIEHVFWTISLNIVFNVLFLHWPAQAGMCLFDVLGYNQIPYFQLPAAILTGYIIIFAFSSLIHKVARFFGINVLYTMSAILYLILKVFLLIVTEVALFPIICGWWLDICSLPLTGATLDARINMFYAYPSSSMFLHWLVGMIYVFYSASFILVLRELLRPGVLWFIRNLNDPEFNPVLEMIQQPLTRHFRRLIASTTLFFTIILLVVYFPLRLICWISAGTLPYAFTATADTPLGELSFELILLQIVMPTVLEYSKAFSILKILVQLWCRIIGGWLKLDSFLLPKRQENDEPVQQPNNNANNEPAIDNEVIVEEAAASLLGVNNYNTSTEQANNINNVASTSMQHSINEPSIQDNLSLSTINDNSNQEVVPEPVIIQQPILPVIPPPLPFHQQMAQARQQRQENHLAARHQALLMMRDVLDYEDYDRPDMFALRIIALLILLSITAVGISFLLFLVPVSGTANNGNSNSQKHQIHDLYTIAAGLYFCWLVSKIWIISYEWFQKGRNYVCKVFCSTAWLALRLIAGAIPLLIIIPFMLGSYFQLLVVGPLRVSFNQTPLFFPWKGWAMGIVHFKIFCASVLMGPDWWFKAIYTSGVRGFELKYLYINLVLPLINFISLQISLPYLISKFILLFFDLSSEEIIVFTRYSYPCTLISIGVITFLFWQWQKLKDIALKIRNDKYLIGTQLVNFYRESSIAAINSSRVINS